VGLFSRKSDDGVARTPGAPAPQERVEMPTRFGLGFKFGNDMMKWGNQQMADATQMLATMNQTDGLRQRLNATGLDGTATIRGLRDTGQQVNLNPVYELDLAVEVPGLSPYEMTRVSEVNIVAVPELVIGAQVPVKVDAADPSQLVIRWMNGAVSS
jgi:hypothetical protein